MVLLFMMYVAIEWSDLVLYPVSFPLNTCMGGNKPGNIGRFKTLTSGCLKADATNQHMYV